MASSVSRRFLHFTLLIAPTLLLADAVSAASFLPVSQDRRLGVSARASIPVTFLDDGMTVDETHGFGDAAAAAGLGDWNETLIADFVVDQAFIDSFPPQNKFTGVGIGESVTSTATLDSTIGSSIISAAGSARVDWNFPGSDPASAGAESFFELTFVLDEDTNATFSGDASYFASAFLFRTDNTFVIEPWIGSFGPFSQDVFLTAGEYRLVASTSLGGFDVFESNPALSSYSVTLSIPEPAPGALIAAGLGVFASALRRIR